MESEFSRRPFCAVGDRGLFFLEFPKASGSSTLEEKDVLGWRLTFCYLHILKKEIGVWFN
jgi:hypothetical protein